MRRLGNLPIRRRVTVVILLVFGCALALSAAGVWLHQSISYRHRAVAELDAYSELMALRLQDVVAWSSPTEALGVLQRLEKGSRVDFAHLFALDEPSPQASMPRSLRPPSFLLTATNGSWFSDDGLWIMRTMKDDRGREFARIALHSRLDSLREERIRSTMVLAVVMLAALACSLVAASYLNRSLTQPLSALANTVHEITAKEDHSLRAPKLSGDEVGSLAADFNRMLDVVADRDAAVRAATHHIQSVFDATTEVMIIATDTRGVVTLFNSGAERMLGYRAAEVVGIHTPLLWHTPHEIESRAREQSSGVGGWQAGFEVLTQSASRGEPAQRDWTFVRKNGQWFDVQLVISCIREANDTITGFLGVATDITERKRVRLELQRREEQFRSLIENASDIITVIDEQACIRFQSPSSERILGFPARDMIHKVVLDYVHPDDHAATREKLLSGLRTPGVTITFQVRLRHQDGSWRLIQAAGRAVSGESDRREFILNARDVTENARLEEQVRQSQKLEAIGQLSGGVAHDFNNILTVIQGHVSLLETCDPLPVEAKESIEEIRVSANRAANLTRQLLAFSRRQTMQLATLDLNEVVNHMTRMLCRILGEDIAMHIRCASQPALVRADSGMMEQIVMNLAVNSRDAMPMGGQLLVETDHIEIDEATAALTPHGRQGCFVRLSISDTGAGIPPEVLPHIFEPFFTTKDVGKGTGLGLATVYGIVQQHGGWINVHSESGRGTTFRIFIPCTHETCDNPAAPSPMPPASLRGTETILLVEDEPSLRTLTRKSLEALGYTILEAPTGAAAIDVWKAHSERIDHLITDLVMPDGISGRELARRLQAERPGLRIIFISGYSADIAGHDFPLQEGVNFLSKPFPPKRLAQVLRASLDDGNPARS